MGRPAEYGPPVTITVTSKPDLTPPTQIRGLTAAQRQIDYLITVQGTRFMVPGVWALQTVGKDPEGNEVVDSYFDPEVGKAITEAIFRHNFPPDSNS